MHSNVNKRSNATLPQEDTAGPLSSSAKPKKNKRRSKRRKGPTTAGEKCCLFLIMMTPLLLVLGFIRFMTYYNELVETERREKNLRLDNELMKKVYDIQKEAQNAKTDDVSSIDEDASLDSSESDEDTENDDKDMNKDDDTENDDKDNKDDDSNDDKDSSDEDQDETSNDDENKGDNEGWKEVKEVEKTKETLVLYTKLGDIRITMRPDLSQGSVDYIHRLIAAGCERCKLYRAEERGILQGIMAKKGVSTNTEKGSCPPGAEREKVGDCPSWDKQCACHGPIMTRGAVAWAAGQAGGPEFFI